MKVNANTLRQGQVVEIEGKLYAVVKADNIQPGKGTPVTQLELRRISDGVKITERYRTTESVERAFIDEGEFQFLFQDGDNLTFMDITNYEQVTVNKEIIGDPVAFLQESMTVTMRLYEGVPVSVELPKSVILEVMETEPVVKGQTASSSYKPAVMDNGVRVMVPPHIGVGAKIVVSTDEGAYMERVQK